ncbi:hypothetical protein Tco_1090172 [Tanacetum coccineum]|uniref:Uncharacterized protein n=1 Tax=Tanacetum coccineum TaxID=301880 RepID=A0ABQ5I4E3_9ASTR
MLSDTVMLEADTKKAMKASLCDIRSQHQTVGSSEGAGITPEVPDEPQAKSIDKNEGAGIIPEVPDVYKATSMIQDFEEDWGSEEYDVILTSEDERTGSKKETTKSGKNDDDMSIDLDETDDEEDEHVDDETQRDQYVHEDEYVHENDEYVHEEDEHVHDYVEEELNDAKIAKTVEGDKELTDPNKAEFEKIKEVKGYEDQVGNALAIVDQAKYASTQDNQAAALISVTHKGKPELPPTSSSLLVSSGFVIPEHTVLTPIPEIITEAPVTTTSPLIPILTSFTSTIQQSTPIPTPTTTIEDPSATTILPVSETLSTIQLRASELEKEVKELKKVDHSTTIHVSIRSQVPTAVNEYLGTSLGDTLQKVLQKHTEELRHEFSQKDVSKNHKIKLDHATKQQLPKHSAKPFD